jgi:hypothetical protein
VAENQELVKEKESRVVFGGGDVLERDGMEPGDRGATSQGSSHGCGAATPADAQTAIELLIGTFTGGSGARGVRVGGTGRATVSEAASNSIHCFGPPRNRYPLYNIVHYDAKPDSICP